MAKLELVRTPEPPERLIKEALEELLIESLGQFAISLETARQLFRKWPDLVTAGTFPSMLRKAYIGEFGCEPDDAGWQRCIYGIRGLDPAAADFAASFCEEFRAEIRERAHRLTLEKRRDDAPAQPRIC